MRFPKGVIFILIVVSFCGGLFARHFNNSVAEVKASSERFIAEAGTIGGQSTTDKEEGTQTLLFVGDIMLSRGIDYFIRDAGKNDQNYPFLKIADTLRSADFTFGNFENPASSRGKNQGSIYSFRVRPELIPGLTFAGFDAVSVANNHIWDYGKDALEDTLTLLKANSITPIGAGMDYAAANNPNIITVGEAPSEALAKDGLRVAFLAYTNLMPRSLEATASRPGLSQFDPVLIKQAIMKARKSSSAPNGATEDKGADLVIVSLHWGEEYKTSANAVQRELAHEFINAGADLVIGHHPHVVQEVEKYKQGYIAYSLGNFVFDQQQWAVTRRGLMLEVIVRDKKIAEVIKIPTEINSSGQVEIVDSH